MDNNQSIAAPEKTGSKFNLIEFARETRREIGKVTWPTRKETVMTTVMIVSMALIVGMFFFCVDYVLGLGIGRLLGMQGS
jgi:preprotein translocase subunit SecE